MDCEARGEARISEGLLDLEREVTHAGVGVAAVEPAGIPWRHAIQDVLNGEGPLRAAQKGAPAAGDLAVGPA